MHKEETPASNDHWSLAPQEVKQRILATFNEILEQTPALREPEQLALLGNALGLVMALRLADLVGAEEHRSLERVVFDKTREIRGERLH